MQDGRDTGLNEAWSGAVLKDKDTATVFSDAFWPVARKEAENLCRTREGAANLARLVLAEMRRDYSERPLPKDVTTEIVVRTCLLFGKWCYDEKTLAERVKKLREERGETPAPQAPRSEMKTEPYGQSAERTVFPADERPSGRTEPPQSVVEPAPQQDLPALEPLEQAEGADQKEPVYADSERKNSGPEPERIQEPRTERREPAFREEEETPRPSRRRTARRYEGDLRGGAQEAYPAETGRSFPHLYESPQIQINFMSPDWQSQKPVVQYVYPEKGTPRRTRTARPEPEPAPETIAQSEAEPPRKDAQKKGFFRREKTGSTQKAEGSDSRLYMVFMAVAALAAVASLVFLVWQVFFTR